MTWFLPAYLYLVGAVAMHMVARDYYARKSTVDDISAALFAIIWPVAVPVGVMCAALGIGRKP